MSETKVQLGFTVEGKLKFEKGEFILNDQIKALMFNMGNHELIPAIDVTYYTESKHANMFMQPYILDLSLIEQNKDKEARTVMMGEFLCISNFAELQKREPGVPQNRVDRVEMRHRYVLKDAYSMYHTTVGGIYQKKTVKQVIQDLWNKTEHGKIQLEMGEFDNKEVYEQIWIPDLKFGDALKYIEQHFGIYTTLTMIYLTWNGFQHRLIIKSINEFTEKPITLYLREATEEKDFSIDNYEYATYKLPTTTNAFNTVATDTPEELSLLKHTTDKIFEEKVVNIIQNLRKHANIDQTDTFDAVLGKYIDPVINVIASNPNTIVSEKELSRFTVNTSEPEITQIPDPFRFPHWYVGRKVDIYTNHLVYSGLDTKFYISRLIFDIKQDDKKKWGGFIHATLETASTRNIKI